MRQIEKELEVDAISLDNIDILSKWRVEIEVPLLDEAPASTICIAFYLASTILYISVISPYLCAYVFITLYDVVVALYIEKCLKF
jgi:hypothetical protein